MPLLYSVTTPAGVIFPILLPRSSVNQRLPSGPATMRASQLSALMPPLYSLIVEDPAPEVAASSNTPSEAATNQRTPELTSLPHSYRTKTVATRVSADGV